MIDVTRHAIQRYLERVMAVDPDMARPSQWRRARTILRQALEANLHGRKHGPDRVVGRRLVTPGGRELTGYYLPLNGPHGPCVLAVDRPGRAVMTVLTVAMWRDLRGAKN